MDSWQFNETGLGVRCRGVCQCGSLHDALPPPKWEVRCTTVIIFMPQATNVGIPRRATIAMLERGSQHRWSSHRREIEDENVGELHGRIAK
jgi:hypothetical protein